jgi:hypothetical protein
MKLFGRTLTSPITLLPLDQFQRHLLAGLSGLLVWVITSVLPWGEEFESKAEWSWYPEMPILEGLGNHFQSSLSSIIRIFWDYDARQAEPWIDFVCDLLDLVIGILPTILSGAMLVSSAVMLLGAFKIFSYPARLQRLAPTILGVAVGTVLFVQALMPPFTAITAVVFPESPWMPQEFSFNFIWWVEKFIDVSANMAAPIAVLLVSLVPIFSPEKKVSKRTR